METNIIEEKNECDSITALELQKSKRTLYFSDGIMEELSESDEEDIESDSADKSMNVNIDLNTLTLGYRIKYQAYEIVKYLLNGLDYVGEGLASFFGITTPKYLSESDIEHAAKVEQKMYNDMSHSNDVVGWNNNNTNPSNIVITRFPPNVVNA